jgi:hypothetical protein
MNNKNNILQKFKHEKILGRGSEGIVIMTHNNKYTIKIYNKPYLTAIIFLKIINYLQDCKKLPKTIYKSYLFTSSFNSFNRYVSNNSLPNHYSYKNMDNFEELSSKYKMDKKLYEIMKTYKMTLRTFLENLNFEINDKKNILKSLFDQGLITLIWLYVNKGIVHNDFSYDNFFIEETKKLFVKIGNYKVQLFGYYIVIADFGYAKSMEMVDYKNYPGKIATLIRNELNPITNINEFINLFNIIFLKYEINENIEEFENIKLNILYKELVKLYIQNDDTFEIKLYEFKSDFYQNMEKRFKFNLL